MSDFKAYCTESFVVWGFAPDPLGELTALPRPPRWILGAYFEGKGMDERGREGRPEKGRKGKRGGKGQGRGRGGEGAGSTPQAKAWPPELFLAPALWKAHIGLFISVN